MHDRPKPITYATTATREAAEKKLRILRKRGWAGEIREVCSLSTTTLELSGSQWQVRITGVRDGAA